MLRYVNLKEQKQHGCYYCLDVRYQKDGNGVTRTCCMHESCPYKVLNKYESYDQFIQSEDSMIFVNEFFDTASGKFRLEEFTSRGKVYIN